MADWRTLASLVVALGLTGTVQAQTWTLTESPLKDSYFHVHLSMVLTGTLKLHRDGREIPLKETATATHDFVERLLEEGVEGTAGKAARVYKAAKVSIMVDSERLERALSPEHSFVMAQRERGQDRVLTYCPKGQFTREELDVTDHFDTLAITGLLPAKSVAMGEAWRVGNVTTQALCGLQALSEQTLSGKLERVQGDVATFTVSGTVTGIDLGAAVSATVKATCLFDTKKQCLVSVDWVQKDERGPGPVSPASTQELTIKLTRTPVEPVTELSDVLLVPVRDVSPGPAWTDLYFKDAKDRFELVHARDWQLVGRSNEHVVMRLLDRGELVAQVTIAPWKKAEPGKHLSAEEFNSVAANSPGWAQETFIKAEEVKLPSGQWAYLVAGEGDLDGVRVVQYFYLVAAPSGDQLVLTFTMTPAQTQKLGSRDVEFVQGLRLLETR